MRKHFLKTIEGEREKERELDGYSRKTTTQNVCLVVFLNSEVKL